MCDEYADVLNVVDADTAANESSNPDARGPDHCCSEFLPSVSEERLVDLIDADNRKEDRENYRCGFVGLVRVEGPAFVVCHAVDAEE